MESNRTTAERVRELVRASVLRREPHGLLPYELMHGVTVAEASQGRLRDQTAEAGAEGGSGVVRHFEVPDLERRFLQAVEIIEAGVAVTRLQRGETDQPTRRVRSEVHRVSLLGDATAEDFCFYVAGGFVVSQILGFGRYTDVDVFFRPKILDDGTCLVATGQGIHPVSPLMVEDVKAWIQTFDLQICQCALKCVVRGNERRYQLMLTRGCALAFMTQSAQISPFPLVTAQLDRLFRRMQKYERRGLYIDDDAYRQARLWRATEDLSPQPLEHLPALFFRPTMQLEWDIDVTFGKINSVTLWPRQGAFSARGVVSEPVLFHPCGRDASLRHMAFVDEPWYARALLTRSEMLVAVPGFGRVSSAMLKPKWLMARSHMTHEEIVGDIRANLERLSEPRGLDVDPSMRERYSIRCACDGRTMCMLKEYRFADIGESCPYLPSWMVYLCVGVAAELRAYMFCVSSKRVTRVCVDGCHDVRARDALLW